MKIGVNKAAAFDAGDAASARIAPGWLFAIEVLGIGQGHHYSEAAFTGCKQLCMGHMAGIGSLAKPVFDGLISGNSGEFHVVQRKAKNAAIPDLRSALSQTH